MQLNGLIALKEWAVAVSALNQGEQVVIMRKGGIAEETKDFAIQSHRFFLFPAWEHQKAHLLKPDYHKLLAETLEEGHSHPDEVYLHSFAELQEDIEISSDEQLFKLRDEHIWSDHFASERLRWKKTRPLHVMLLRVYLLDKPIVLPMSSNYTGCKSWIQPEYTGSTIEELQKRARPVLTEQQFKEKADRIRRRLQSVD